MAIDSLKSSAVGQVNPAQSRPAPEAAERGPDQNRDKDNQVQVQAAQSSNPPPPPHRGQTVDIKV